MGADFKWDHIGYARVSTSDQRLDMQFNALREFGVPEDHTFYETKSGASPRRPMLEKAYKYLRRGDTLVVWKLDRLGRDLEQVSGTIKRLNQWGVRLKSLTEGFDTTSASGRMVAHMLATTGHYERDAIVERTLAGIQAAKERGTWRKRSVTIDEAQWAFMVTLLQDNPLLPGIAKSVSENHKMTQAYPLKWPDGRPRTRRPERSRFDTSFVVARDSLSEELRRLGARNCVLSTNVELRLDGLPYASRKDPDDAGVAVYFTYDGQQMCFACDRWDRVKDNIQAVRKTIEALRGIARWGTGDMMKKAFDGFQALPSPDTVQQRQWFQVLGVSPDATPDQIKSAHRKLAKQHHADTGAEGSLMADINTARDIGMKRNGYSRQWRHGPKERCRSSIP